MGFVTKALTLALFFLVSLEGYAKPKDPIKKNIEKKTNVSINQKSSSKPKVNPPGKLQAKQSAKKVSTPKPSQTKGINPKPKKPVNNKKKESSGKKSVAVKKKPVAPEKKKTLDKKPVIKKAKPAGVKTKAPSKQPVNIKRSKEPPKKSIGSIKKKPLQSERLVILDAGHGGYDLGCRLAACNEKSLALSTAFLTKKKLTDKGYKVLLTRSRDVFLPLSKRVQIANDTKSKIFVSVHFNSAKNTDAKGIEVFFYKSKDKFRTQASKALAVRVLSKMVDLTEAKNRGVKHGNFHVIRETSMPAILVEGGFITNDDERALLRDVKYREKLSKGIAEGVDSFFQQ